jgi:hypothetical protein
MTDDSPQPARSGLSLTVTVSSQAAFVPTLQALAERIGAYAGFRTEEARHFAQAVGRALVDAFNHLGPDNPPDAFEIVFQGTDRLLRVDMSCKGPLPAGVTLEQLLGGPAAVDDLRRLVDRVEFGQAEGAPYCRITQQIRDSH